MVYMYIRFRYAVSNLNIGLCLPYMVQKKGLLIVHIPIEYFSKSLTHKKGKCGSIEVELARSGSSQVPTKPSWLPSPKSLLYHWKRIMSIYTTILKI